MCEIEKLKTKGSTLHLLHDLSTIWKSNIYNIIRMPSPLKQYSPITLMDSISSCNDRLESSRILHQTVMSHVYYAAYETVCIIDTRKDSNFSPTCASSQTVVMNDTYPGYLQHFIGCSWGESARGISAVTSFLSRQRHFVPGPPPIVNLSTN
jgi:hypothetical protein